MEAAPSCMNIQGVEAIAQQETQQCDRQQIHIAEVTVSTILLRSSCCSTIGGSSRKSSPLPVQPGSPCETGALSESAIFREAHFKKGTTDASHVVGAMATAPQFHIPTPSGSTTSASFSEERPCLSENKRAKAMRAPFEASPRTPMTVAATTTLKKAKVTAVQKHGKVHIILRVRRHSLNKPKISCCRVLEPGNALEHIATTRNTHPVPSRRAQAFPMEEIQPQKEIKSIFNFDAILGTDTSQADVMTRVGNGMLQRVLEGYNATVMCYGQSGSGKTHTMIGPAGGDPAQMFNPEDAGLLPRMLEDLMAAIQKKFPSRVEKNECAPLTERQGRRWRIEVSALELYQEELRDLLVKRLPTSLRLNATVPSNAFNLEEYLETTHVNFCDRIPWPVCSDSLKQIDRKSSLSRVSICSSSRSRGSRVSMARFPCETGNLRIRENAEWGVAVEGLSWYSLQCKSDMMHVLTHAIHQRRTGPTALNGRSSRSHFFFFVAVLWWDGAEEDLLGTGKPPKEGWTRSLLTFVDLAGSERVKTTRAVGPRLKEARHINLSLTLLGNVIRKLTETSEEKLPFTHVPYRDSKLTRLLQNSIGGNAFTVLLCTVSPEYTDADETLSTLKFAQRAKRMRNRPLVNHAVSNTELVSQLQAALARISCLENQLVLVSGRSSNALCAQAVELERGTEECEVGVKVGVRLSGQQLAFEEGRCVKGRGAQSSSCEEYHELLATAALEQGASSSFSSPQQLRHVCIPAIVVGTVKRIDPFHTDNHTTTGVCLWSEVAGSGRYRRRVGPLPPPYPPYFFEALVCLLQAVVPSLRRQHPPAKAVFVPVGNLQHLSPPGASWHSSSHEDESVNADMGSACESASAVSATPRRAIETPRTAAENRRLAEMLMQYGATDIIQT